MRREGRADAPFGCGASEGVAVTLLLAVEESDIGAGPIGLLILLLMLIATFLLIRNMKARIKRLPREFHEQERQDPDPDPDPPTPR